MDNESEKSNYTKYIVFHTPRRKVTYPELKIHNILIDRVSEFSC